MSLIVTTLVVPAARPGRVRPLAAPRALHERGARSPRAARAERAAVFASSLYATMTSAKWGRRRADEHFSPAVVLSSEGLLGLLPDASGRNRQALAAGKRERVVFRCYLFHTDERQSRGACMQLQLDRVERHNDWACVEIGVQKRAIPLDRPREGFAMSLWPSAHTAQREHRQGSSPPRRSDRARSGPS